jgi:hypothetical protein
MRAPGKSETGELPGKSETGELEVYKMLERLGIELGAGVVPRYGLMYMAAVRTCRRCGSSRACAAWVGSQSASCIAPDFCPNADIFTGLAMEGPTRDTTRH